MFSINRYGFLPVVYLYDIQSHRYFSAIFFLLFSMQIHFEYLFSFYSYISSTSFFLDPQFPFENNYFIPLGSYAAIPQIDSQLRTCSHKYICSYLYYCRWFLPAQQELQKKKKEEEKCTVFSQNDLARLSELERFFFFSLFG